MMQIVKQTREEKIAMYMKCTKKQLAEMLASIDMIDQSALFEPECSTVTMDASGPIVEMHIRKYNDVFRSLS